MKDAVFRVMSPGPHAFDLTVGGSAEPDSVEIEITNHGPEPIDAPWLWTDHTIDCFSCERILEQILTPGMSDSEIIVAITHFLASHVLHTTGSTDLAQGPDFYNLPGNPIYNLNSLGTCSCGHFTAVAIQLLEAAGWTGGPRAFTWKGHTVCMTPLPTRNERGDITGFDTSRWYMIDADGIRGPIYSLAHPGQLADLDELQANARSAIIATCTMPNGRMASGLPATEYARMVDTLADNRFYDDQSPLHLHQGHRMHFRLRPGETLIRSFRNVGATTLENGQPRQLSTGQPCHMYGSNDGVYPAPQYERPHVFGNGLLRYAPDPHDAFEDGQFAYEVNLPYGLVGARLSLEMPDSCSPEISIRFGNVGESQSVPYTPQAGLVTVDLTPHFHGRVYFDYRLEIRLPSGTIPKQLQVQSIFLCNLRSLPHLEAGLNRLHYRDSSADATPRNLSVTWRYADRNVPIDVERSELLVLDADSEWTQATAVPADRNGFALVLVSLFDTNGRPAEGCKVSLETSRPMEDLIIPETSYTVIADRFEHHTGFEHGKGVLSLNTMSAPVTTVDNQATLRIRQPNQGLKDRFGREYLGTRLFRVYSKSPGVSTFHARLADGRQIPQTVQIKFV